MEMLSLLSLAIREFVTQTVPRYNPRQHRYRVMHNLQIANFSGTPVSPLVKNLHSHSSNSPLKKREENCAELAFTKTSGSATGDREKKLANS